MGILVENSDFLIPMHLYSTPPLGGGLRGNIAITFGKEKLKWCSYQLAKGLRIYLLLHELDRRTDGRTNRHRTTA